MSQLATLLSTLFQERSRFYLDDWIQMHQFVNICQSLSNKLQMAGWKELPMLVRILKGQADAAAVPRPAPPESAILKMSIRRFVWFAVCFFMSLPGFLRSFRTRGHALYLGYLGKSLADGSRCKAQTKQVIDTLVSPQLMHKWIHMMHLHGMLVAHDSQLQSAKDKPKWPQRIPPNKDELYITAGLPNGLVYSIPYTYCIANWFIHLQFTTSILWILQYIISCNHKCESVTPMLQCATSVDILSNTENWEPLETCRLCPGASRAHWSSSTGTLLKHCHTDSTQNITNLCRTQENARQRCKEGSYSIQLSTLVAGLSRGQRTVKTSKLKHFL